MESLTSASEVLAQLKLLTDVMALICQDISVQQGVDNGEVDETADNSAPFPTWPPTIVNSGLPCRVSPSVLCGPRKWISGTHCWMMMTQ